MLVSDLAPGTIILEAVTGSKAYGLDTPESDEDLKAIYVAPTMNLLRLKPPPDTINRTNPDITIHELSKFVNLALKCNPTILELLFLDEYRVLLPVAEELIHIRQAFLSARLVNDAYGGYAIQQAKKLEKRGADFGSDLKHRYSKHARHCWRLMDQGQQLKTTGDLRVRVTNREELFAIGELAPEQLVEQFTIRFAEFEASPNVLPERPDSQRVENVLMEIREIYLRGSVV